MKRINHSSYDDLSQDVWDGIPFDVETYKAVCRGEPLPPIATHDEPPAGDQLALFIAEAAARLEQLEAEHRCSVCGTWDCHCWEVSA